MKVIIRIKSPNLKKLLRRRPRIERLSGFSESAIAPRQSSPLVVWIGSVATVVAFVCLAMVAGLESTGFSTLGQVGQSLVERVTPPTESAADMPRPPEASYPYGSVPPLQSEMAPVARPAISGELMR